MQRIIEQTEDGSATLYVPQLDEHYHSVKGARTESRHIFIEQGLNTSAAACPNVIEIGFGTGLNALLTLETAEKTRRQVHYTGIELYPLRWEEVEVLHYSDNPLFRPLHDAPWNEEVKLTPYFTLYKVQADVPTIIGSETQPDAGTLPQGSPLPDRSYDVVYFDAFAPDKQPEMWSEALFRGLYRHMNPGGILTTYCAKGAVRRLLQAVGFRVERLAGPPGGKREILRANKDR